MDEEDLTTLMESPRWPELMAYAEREGISYARAVVVMVNRGLSYTDELEG